MKLVGVARIELEGECERLATAPAVNRSHGVTGESRTRSPRFGASGRVCPRRQGVAAGVRSLCSSRYGPRLLVPRAGVAPASSSLGGSRSISRTGIGGQLLGLSTCISCQLFRHTLPSRERSPITSVSRRNRTRLDSLRRRAPAVQPAARHVEHRARIELAVPRLQLGALTTWLSMHSFGNVDSNHANQVQSLVSCH